MTAANDAQPYPREALRIGLILQNAPDNTVNQLEISCVITTLKLPPCCFSQKRSNKLIMLLSFIFNSKNFRLLILLFVGSRVEYIFPRIQRFYPTRVS